MKRRIITVTLTLRVYDVRAFRQAARQRALQDGLSVPEANQYTRSKTVAECAHMLLDPGQGPDGSEILDGNAEEVSGL